MTAKKERPALRVIVILGSVAILGLFLGWMLERMFYGAIVHEDEAELPVLDTLAAAPSNASGPTEWEIDTIRRAVEGLPRYPGAVPQALAADYLGANAPIAVAWFTTKDSPDRVLEYYRDAFVDAGIPSNHARASENGGYVGYMVPTTGFMRVITALAQGGQTVVFASNGNVIPALERSGEVPADLPHPPAATDTLVMNLNQEQFGDVSVVATVEGADLEEWVKFYSDGFAERGWKIERVLRPNAREAHLEAVREGRHALTLIRRSDRAQQIEILVRVSGEV